MKTAMRLLPVVFLSMSVSAMGQILNSKHDLRATSSGPDAANVISTLTEICLPCHTPHNATDNTNMDDPLWNHQMTTQTFGMYTTLSGTTGDANGASKLCLSCHDGATAMDNYGGTTTGTVMMTGTANVGLDLSNDHPIGLTYPPTAGSYETAANVKSAGLRLPNDGTNDRVECQSCHDPHNTTTLSFLRISNTDSALCTTCHTL